MLFFIGQVLPYITVAIFVIGITWRVWRWMVAGIPHNITLSPFPKSWGGAIGIMAAQVVVFWNILKFDRPLWFGGWPMHVALGAIIGGHAMGIYFLGTQFTYIGLSVAASKDASNLLGSFFGVIFFVALLYLLYRRIFIEKVRVVSAVSDYLHLVLLLAIVGIGDYMRFFAPLHYEEARAFMAGLFTLKPEPLPPNIYFILHFLLVQILMIVFPFSKLMHPLGMFWERWIVNRPYKEIPMGMPGVKLYPGTTPFFPSPGTTVFKEYVTK